MYECPLIFFGGGGEGRAGCRERVGVEFLLQFWFYAAGAWGPNISEVSTVTTSHFFSSYNIAGPPPGITVQEFPLQVSELQKQGSWWGEGRCASLRASPPSHTNAPRPQNKGMLCQEQVLHSVGSELGHHLITQNRCPFLGGLGILVLLLF